MERSISEYAESEGLFIYVSFGFYRGREIVYMANKQTFTSSNEVSFKFRDIRDERAKLLELIKRRAS